MTRRTVVGPRWKSDPSLRGRTERRLTTTHAITTCLESQGPPASPTLLASRPATILTVKTRKFVVDDGPSEVGTVKWGFEIVSFVKDDIITVVWL